jgi:phospholipid-translocating ATPase
MSAPHQYHQPNAPDPADDDSDSDLDLELQELAPGPAASSADQHSRSPAHSRNGSHNTHDFARRIPLRNLNLRTGRQRNRHRDGEDEDLDELLHDGTQADRDSAGSVDSAHDGAPLLPTLHGRRRRRDESPTALSKLGSRLRFPSFRSDPSNSPTHNPSSADQEPEDEHDPSSNRIVAVGQRQSARFPPNAISNAKYTPLSFVPRTLYNEFKFFLNMYFLLVALSQIIPALRIGYLTTYIAPLAFVLAVTLGKEALDDIARRRRDAEANAEPYTVLQFEETSATGASKRGGRRHKGRGGAQNGSVRPEHEEGPTGGAKVSFQEFVRPAKDIRVGDILKLGKDQRVPADVVILKSISNDTSTVDTSQLEALSSEPLIETEGAVSNSIPQVEDPASESEVSGEAFIRTDQLDGETDWKLRLPSQLSQRLEIGDLTKLKITASKPDKKVNEFIGTLDLTDGETIHDVATGEANETAPLSIDNTAWANTVLASSSTVYAVVVYTGSQTRQAMSTSASRSKVGLLELEINSLTKILCALTLSLSIVLVLIGRIEHQEARQWYISVMRFLILFSTVVPISLRVNLDMGKTVYAWFIEHDRGIPGTVVRTSTIPEDLGRVEYLLSDKTGTLTQNGKYSCASMTYRMLTIEQRWSSKKFTLEPSLMPMKQWMKLRHT